MATFVKYNGISAEIKRKDHDHPHRPPSASTLTARLRIYEADVLVLELDTKNVVQVKSKNSFHSAARLQFICPLLRESG